MSILNLEQLSTHLRQLNFNLLFTDVLGWNHPPPSERTWQGDETKNIRYQRRIASNTNERSLIASILPRQVFANHKLMIERRDVALSAQQQSLVVAILNSYVFDYMVRQRVTTSISMYAFYQIPVPRINSTDVRFSPIVTHAARLICTTPEFDDLAKEVGLESHKKGATDPIERARLRAELDGLIAHLYGLTELEFAHILTTFPLVKEPVKVAALNAYRDVERGLVK